MASASHQSKQKQQTSKKDLQEKKNNQEIVTLKPEQAGLFKDLFENSRRAENQLNIALTAAGLVDVKIISGQLDGENPHFVVQITTEH